MPSKRSGIGVTRWLKKKIDDLTRIFSEIGVLQVARRVYDSVIGFFSLHIESAEVERGQIHCPCHNAELWMWPKITAE